MKSPKITAFIAAYNASDYIEESVSSILNQTFKDFELIIIDDGSTDDTALAVKKFNDNRIRFLQNDVNKGLPFTRNRLLELANGEYIAILDSDDIAYPDRFQLQLNFFSSHPEVALCGGHGTIINENGIEADKKIIVPTDDSINMRMLFANSFINSSTMFKTEIFKALNGYRDFALAEDFDLFTRISEKYKVANIDAFLVKYRIHGENITIKRSEDQGKNELEILKNMQDNLGMSFNTSSLNLHKELLTNNLNEAHFAGYLELLIAMKVANTKSKRFDTAKLNRFLFNKWYEILRLKKSNAKALNWYFKKELYNVAYFNFKQFRKIFKITLRGLIS
ncbi:glycosyltransferase family 2 protein [Pedobacter kyonggii]|uniref:Glycosyltransferase family 2 protein n=1 Tax=Pedobacter kyonggii TaxID=1926871 RepID=A0A4Q9HIF5_9SPHI|nr:glycosyltransferase family A protein [Pedobacter kyonggii]TBO45163.1 glycosyltransferase family 2 protein [Pedobacter kyonggii]